MFYLYLTLPLPSRWVASLIGMAACPTTDAGSSVADANAEGLTQNLRHRRLNHQF